MTREEAIANLNMISVAFVEPVTKEQRKLIDDTFDTAIKALEQEPKIVPIAEIKFDEDELKELVDKAVLTVTPQEPIDYNAQYESFAKKAEIVISQLRADRDRLADVFDKIRAEIMDFEEELFHRPNTDYSDYAAVRHCMEIIDKYKAESENKE